MAIDTSVFRVHHDQKVEVSKLPTAVDPLYVSKRDYKDQLKANVKKLGDLQERLYAENRQSLLIVLQAMDTGGKDGLIQHVFSGINPQGCQVTSFGVPSATELEHDFLWRTSLHLPARGTIGVFNRSYYEEVLVVRVHPQILDGQNLPKHLARADSIWEDRFRSIHDYEKHLAANGTRVVKLFLNLSKEEQARRLLARIEEPDKNWKYKASDLEQRAFWDDYQRVYSACLSNSSTKAAPWYSIPADDKQNARLIASTIVREALEAMDPKYPEASEEAIAAFEAGRKELQADLA